MNALSLSLRSIPFGAVVLAEPGVSMEEMRRDLENIRRLHFNTIVLYPSVSRWEGVSPGHTAFDTIDRIMDMCADLGIKVILELQGQVMQDADAPECFDLPPGFPSENYRENGFHMPAKQILLRQYLQEVVSHFKNHPALLAYDVFNEIGNNSRSPETIQAFARFLHRQYDGDIQTLNLAWATYFKDFAAIAAAPPHYRVWSWSSVVAERDWQRFRSIDFKEQIASWRSIIQEIDPETPLFVDVLGCDVHQNRTDPYYGVSDWDAVEETDILGLSCYANMLCREWWTRDAWLWPQFWRHALSVADGRQTIISELMTRNRNLFPTEKSSLQDEILLWSYQALFHGIKGLIYWKYRPFRRGRQVGGRGLTDSTGEPDSAGFQAAEVARFSAEHADLLAGLHPDDAGCAILHDPETERLYAAIGIGVDHAHGSAHGQSSSFYTDAHRGWFHALWSRGIQPSYLTPDRIHHGLPAHIRVLVVPCHANLSPELAATLHTFVHQGGMLITESRFGRITDDGMLWPCAPGAGMHAWTGIEEGSFTCRFRDGICISGRKLVFHDDYFQELKIAPSVNVLLRTQSGHAALVSNTLGRGQYIHLPFLFGHKAGEDFSPGLLACFDVLFSQIKPFLTPALSVESKDPLVDVSVLLDAQNIPRLLGICNYHSHPSRVILRCRHIIHPHSSSGKETSLSREDGCVTIHLPARSVFSGGLTT